ncbi:replication initiation protein [Frankia sp. B2]|uniref:replication initiator n=1 Tax=Frankia sp. B2 TaxID=2541730 RepID=UPI00106BE15F|nr:replication initiator [Frankia sp. B2]TFE30990.1 replication initiation protein [Frankia sp. B2]
MVSVDVGVSLPENRPVAGGCSRPIRLSGHVDHVDVGTGEVRRAFTSAGEPGGVLHVRCGNRRESACPACSAVYKRDARRLVLAGLAGGKGVPASVSDHPAWFVTLTAPSFGPVHSRRQRGGKTGPVRACHPRRGLCPHGKPAGCHERHHEADSRLGSPLCPDCYAYGRSVVWNALVPRLWKATRDGTESAVAAAAGLTVAGLRRAARLSFVKVAEMQARGVVHLHVVIRVDGPDGPGSAPPAWAAGELVADALRGVLSVVAVPAPDPDALTLDTTAVADDGWAVRWGAQVDIRRIALEGPADVSRVSNYLAKYITKSAAAGGELDHPVRSLAALGRLTLPPHLRRLVETCWRLGHDPVFAVALDAALGRDSGDIPRLVRWAHQAGFGGHWLSKSRAYSTTFTALRTVRRVWSRTIGAAMAGRVPVDAFGRPDGDPDTVILGAWTYAGRGLYAGDHGDDPPDGMSVPAAGSGSDVWLAGL